MSKVNKLKQQKKDLEHARDSIDDKIAKLSDLIDELDDMPKHSNKAEYKKTIKKIKIFDK